MMMFEPLKKYADFQGRARRQEYWLFALFVIIVEAVLLVGTGAGMAAGGGDVSAMAMAGNLLLGVFILGIFIPSLAVLIRRLHDTNRSGWWALITFLPLVGGIWLLVLTVLDGTEGPNRFGADPKGRGTAEVFA